MRTWELMSLAVQSVFRARLRSTLTVLGVSIASGSLVCMIAFVLGLQTQLEAPAQQLGLFNNIEVFVKSDSADDAAPECVLDDAMIRELEAIEGVDFAYPDLRLSQVRVTCGDKSETSYAFGLPREATLMGLFSSMIVEGTFFSLTPKAEVGDRRTTGPNAWLRSARECCWDSNLTRVDRFGAQRRGRIHAATTRNDRDRIWHLPPAQLRDELRWEGGPAAVGCHTQPAGVRARKELAPPAVRCTQRLARLFSGRCSGAAVHRCGTHRTGDSGQGISDPALSSQMEEAKVFFVFMEVLLTAVGTVALIVAGLGILNTLLMSVLQRIREIGIYKAVGASDADIRLLFLTEAALIGLCGGLGGLALARIVAWMIQWGVQQYALRQGVEGPVNVFDFPAWLIASSVAYAILISVVSGLYPANRAAKIDPIEALRYE